MKLTVRHGVFETNSSSSHALCVCTPEEYEKFVKKKLVIDINNDKLIPRPKDFKKYEVPDDGMSEEEHKYIGYNYEPDAYLEFESPSGDKMVAFCYEYYY
jgi:hypothetical protein